MILLSKQCIIEYVKSTGTEGPGNLGKDEVAGSNPAISSIEKPVTATVFGLFAFLAFVLVSKKY